MPLRDPDDRKPFRTMLEALAALYTRELSAGVLALYWNALQAYDLGSVRAAFDRHVKNPDTGQFFPKPADVVRMLEGTTVDAAAHAWAKVERAMRSVGGHVDVVFDDATIHRVVEDMGGWPKLCMTLETDLPFRAKDFQTLYRSYALRREIPSHPPLLIGRFSMQNMQEGHPVQPPVLIGDAQACELVRIGGTAQAARLPMRPAADTLLLPAQ